MILLVCGGRSYGDTRPVDNQGRTHPPSELARRAREVETLYCALDALHGDTPISLVVHGGGSGADWQAGRWAAARGVRWKAIRADWDAYGKAAGPIRNQRMLDEEHPEMVVAFPGDRGTRDMVEKAEKASVAVMMIGAVE